MNIIKNTTLADKSIAHHFVARVSGPLRTKDFLPLIKSVADEYTIYYSGTNPRDIRDNSMINSSTVHILNH